MSGEEETNKKQEKYQGIPKGNYDRNSNEQAVSKPTNTPKTEKSEEKYDLSTKSKIPDLHALMANSINVKNGVMFYDALFKHKIEGKLIFPELLTDMPRNVSTRNVVFVQGIIPLRDGSLRAVKVPDFKIYGSPNIEIRNTNFDVSLVKTVMSGNLSMAVPSLSTDSIRPLIVKNITFDSEIRTKIKEHSESKKQPMEPNPPDEPGNGEDSNMKLPWDEEVHKKIFPLGDSSTAENFKIVAVPDKEEYCEFVAMNFRDIYRIQHGGHVHDIKRANDIGELREKFGKQTANHEIVIVKRVDLSNGDDEDFLIDIIKNKAYGNLGLVVLVVNNMEKFKEKIGTPDDVLILDESDFHPLLEKSNALAKIIRGFSDYPVSSNKFGDNFKNSVKEFDKQIAKYTDTYFVKGKIERDYRQEYEYFGRNKDLLKEERNSSEEDASDIHSGMKGFIYVYEIKNGSKNVRFEASEKEIDVVADKKCYEAETLFGRGGDVVELLDRKTKKCNREGTECSEIIFTMRNIDIIRNFLSLREFLKLHKDTNIKVCGFDLKEEKLVSMNELVRKLR